MEKQILEIIYHHLSWGLNSVDGNGCAKAIAGHFKKFIEWFHFGSHPFVPWFDVKNGKKITWYTDEVSKHKFTFEEVYQYYCDNVLNLKQK